MNHKMNALGIVESQNECTRYLQIQVGFIEGHKTQRKGISSFCLKTLTLRGECVGERQLILS